MAVAVAAACTALTLGLTGALSATPTRTSNALGSTATSGGRTIVSTTAFILTSKVNGIDTLTLKMGHSSRHSRIMASPHSSRAATSARPAPHPPLVLEHSPFTLVRLAP